MNSNPTLFVLEDSLELLTEVDTIVQSLERKWNVNSFKCYDSAMEEMRRCHGNGYSALLLDIMLPRTQSDFDEVTKFSERRISKSLALTDTKNAEERKSILSELRTIDSSIRKKIMLDGGVQFLEQVKAEKLLSDSVNVAYFSALRLDTVCDNGKTLGGRVNALLGHTPFKWFNKPVDPQIIAEWLYACAEK